MKYIILSLTVLSLFSCRSEDEKPVEEISNILGTWKIQKTLVISGSDQATILKEYLPDDCKNKSTYEYTNDNKYIINDFNMIGNECKNSFVTTTYSYLKTENKLIIGGTDTKVMEMLPNKMVLYVTDNYDYNNDGIDDYLRYTYIK